MYTLVVTTPPASEPVTLQELKDHLRLNDNSEDAQLSAYITAARTTFEHKTGLALMPTTFRQHMPTLNQTTHLMRAPITAVTSVSYFDVNDTLQTTTTGYTTDTITVPGSVTFTSLPATSTTRTPVAYVTFTAGYANAAAVPEPIKLAIKLLAAHWHNNREAFTDRNLTALPFGFNSVCVQYDTGVHGPWGMN